MSMPGTDIDQSVAAVPAMDAPFLLYSEITLSLAGGGIALNGDTMKNPDGKAMWIDEITFNVAGSFAALGATTGSPAATSIIQDWGSLWAARLRIGRNFLTSGFVPIWLLSPLYNYDHAWSALAPHQGFVGNNRSTYTYRPPKPIFVPKDENLQCEFSVDPSNLLVCTGTSGSLAITTQKIGVTYRCRTIPDSKSQPRLIDTPYVAKWQSGLFPINAKTMLRSTAGDLHCPFPEVLHVASLIGRIAVNPSGAGEKLAQDAFFVAPSLADYWTTIQLFNANGAIIARDPVPFGHIFTPLTREWKMQTTMDSKSYFLARVTADLRTSNWPGAQNVGITAGIGMHGYRTMDYQSFHS